MGKDRSEDLRVVNHAQHLPGESAQERLADFLSEHGRTLLMVLGSILGILLVLYIWNQWTHGRDEKDYSEATIAMQQLESLRSGDKIAENPSYLKIKAAIDRHPELASRYNGRLAQTFLRLGNLPLAIDYADKALKQLATESLPFYEDYSKTSLLIASNDYPDAYKRALFLSKRMGDASIGDTTIQTRGFGDTLLIFNQIRLAALQQKMGNTAEEVAQWQALLKHPQAAQVLSQIKTGKISFLDYLQARDPNN